MSHIHVHDHVYMEIRLIRLISISIRSSLRFCTKALRTWAGTRHRNTLARSEKSVRAFVFFVSG
jgi:hypothetical protein